MDQRRLSRIEVFVLEAPEPVHYGLEADGNCLYGILKLTCKSGCSWGAGLLTADAKTFDLIKWSSFLRNIRYRRLEEALEIVRCRGFEWEQAQLEIVQGALLDLRASLEGKSITGYTQQGHLHRAVAGGGHLRGNHLYYKPSKARSSPLLQTGIRPEPDLAELMDKSVAYFSVL